MIVNGNDYQARAAELARRGIEPRCADDTAFGAEVYCNQHRRVHSTGWCTVSNIEKFTPEEEWPRPPLPAAARYGFPAPDRSHP